ncbi:hypothetical protein DFQ27_009110, partial [Actinomortierella ambigua]
ASVPLAAVGSAPESSAISREDLSHSISELASRAALSNIAPRFSPPPETNCSGTLQSAIDALKSVEDRVRKIPDIDPSILSVVEQVVQRAISLLQDALPKDISKVLDVLEDLAEYLEPIVPPAMEPLLAILQCVRQIVPKDPANPGTKNTLTSPQEM